MAVMMFTAFQCFSTDSGVYFNSTPAAETTEGNLYFSIEPGLPASLSGDFTLDSTKYTSASLNGAVIKNGASNFNVADWHADGANTLQLTDIAGQTTKWKLIFTSLPIVKINGATQAEIYIKCKEGKTNEEEKLPCQIEIIDPRHRTDKTLYHFESDAKIRVRGATSSGKEKKCFSIDMLDTEGSPRDVRVLGMRNDDDWILDAMYTDLSRMRNRLITDLWTAADTLPYEVDNTYQRNGTMGEYVELIISGEYWGLYCLTDKIDRKKLNLKKTKEASDSTSEEIRGVLWKSTYRCDATTFHQYDDAPSDDSLIWEKYWVQKYPEDRQDQGRFQPLAEMIYALGMGDEQMLADSLEAKLFIGNLLNYHIFTQSLQLMDNLQKNMYCSVRNIKKEKKVLITLWDLDASIGRAAGGDAMSSTNDKWLAFGEQLGGINVLLWRLELKNPNDYRKKFYDRWEKLKATTLNIDSIRVRMEEYGNQFNTSGAWKREYAKWGGPTTAKKIEDEISYMISFLKVNYLAMDKKMAEWGMRDVPVDTLTHEPVIPRDTSIGGESVIIVPEPIDSIDFEKEGEPIRSTATIDTLALEVVTMNADTFLFSFTTKPEISFDKSKFVITADSNVTEWEVPDIDYFTIRNAGKGTELKDVPATDDDKDERYHVYNANGQIVRYDDKEFTLDGLSKGVYIVKCGDQILKVIKK